MVSPGYRLPLRLLVGQNFSPLCGFCSIHPVLKKIGRIQGSENSRARTGIHVEGIDTGACSHGRPSDLVMDMRTQY
jgi:hypothetical protein